MTIKEISLIIYFIIASGIVQIVLQTIINRDKPTLGDTKTELKSLQEVNKALQIKCDKLSSKKDCMCCSIDCTFNKMTSKEEE